MCRFAAIDRGSGSPRGSLHIADGTRRLSSPALGTEGGSRKLDMPRSRAWFFLTHPAEASCDRARYCSVSAAVICALVISSVILTLAASRSLDVTPATADEPIAPIPELSLAAPSKIALGERLFADPRLSGNRARSCASCHDISTNGATQRSQDIALDGSALPLNTSTVFNATLSFRFNWEGGFRTLESQALASLENSRIMGAKIEDVVERLGADPDMVRQVRAAYGRGPDSANLLDAIAAFERSLLTPGSRFDRWLAGDEGALSPEEQNGYSLFKSLGCVSCHQGVNIGGNLFQRHGIFQPLASPLPEILRVPSLRNVANTAPYFHDGSAPTLEDAVRRMGAAQLNSALTDPQVAAIVAYLRTLTGTLRGRPVGISP
jgi:cytochrome c peroxidase